MKKFALIAILALAAISMIGCASATGAGDASHYRLLSDPDALRNYEVLNVPQSYYVTAQNQSGALAWSTKVQGRGKLCTGGSDVLTLNDGMIHKAGDSKITGPYIVGCAASNGVFTPSAVEVVSGPQSGTAAGTQ